ncbi:MAG TPA: TlpA disulfide reductase family protein [Thermohalobaculum sp.]|nr:TlpA disulfide reductase family protein [Thermohalobaculum sp.]
MTRRIASLAAAALLYGAFVAFANPGAAAGLDAADRAELEALSEGGLETLVIHDTPRPPITERWADEHGNPVGLDDYSGEVVVMNFWATWCPPCKAEMPSLDRLAGRMEGSGLAVLPISIDRSPGQIADFFRGARIENLGIHHDRSRAVSRQAGVLGLPATVILDPEGREVARLVGDADWSSPEAVRLIERLVAMLTGPAMDQAGADAAPEG